MSRTDIWAIRRRSGEIVFQGAKQECEDWLDWNENNARELVELEYVGSVLPPSQKERRRPRPA